jgi:transcriptional regulator with XRE-family HTH domain
LQRGKSLTDQAAELGISKSHLSHIEAGRRTALGPLVEKLREGGFRSDVDLRVSDDVFEGNDRELERKILASVYNQLGRLATIASQHDKTIPELVREGIEKLIETYENTLSDDSTT